MSYIARTDAKVVAVIGAGTIGASWSSWFLARGFRVNASDPSPGGEDFVRRFVGNAWPQLVELGVATTTLDEALARLVFTPDVAEACRNADFVQENAPERLEIKQELLARIDEHLPEGRVIASSTSGLKASDMQARMSRPGRLVVAHPFNPPHLIPLVEIVGGRLTDEAACDWALGFYNDHGKRAIRVRKEVPGHIANRLQAALWREAAHLVSDGVASVADVDAAITEGPGLRWAIMGPHLTFHLAGGDGGIRHFADHLGPAIKTWWDDLGSPVVDARLTDMLEAGVREEVGGRTTSELAAERDAKLIALLRTVKSAT
ncbi:MAG: 3-hydroxyacyl-CoA dehydrogenase NAD-binding domain-containing protein [Microvirga sp.]|nr:3-hydroxyacyl-CoA dehydrogenase NAD-binding domain-containing protein [Microvirga sp.]